MTGGSAHGRAKMALVCILVGVPCGRVAAQGLPLGAHYGANMLPDVEHRVDIGVSFLLFTQYGKELKADKTYTLDPYNDIGETLGFNTLSVTSIGERHPFPIAESSVQIRNSLMLGVVGDKVTSWLQNDVAHWAKIRGRARLRRVPRQLGDDSLHTSLGPTKRLPIVQLSQEYFLRLEAQERNGSTILRKPSPIFIGGGLSVGTVNQEVFLQAGLNPVTWRFNENNSCLCGLCLTGAGVGGVARVGTLYPSHHMRDLTGGFVNLQAVGEVSVSIGGFPFSLQNATTSATGYFAESRTALDELLIAQRDDQPEGAYDLKRPKSERFMSWRLQVGDFGFEYLNDAFGGKDKGPSFGISTTYQLARSDAYACQIANNGPSDRSSASPNWVKRLYAAVIRHVSCI